jgi:hypothetical protein
MHACMHVVDLWCGSDCVKTILQTETEREKQTDRERDRERERERERERDPGVASFMDRNRELFRHMLP